MSAAEQIPGSEPSQEGTEAGVVETPAESPAGSSEVGEDVGQTQEVDWQKQAKHHQRLHNQLVDKLGPLRTLLDQAHGSQLLPMITAWDRAVNDPNLGPVIRRWTATGQVTPAEPTVTPEPDPYEDESQKAMRLKVEALERELAGIRQTNASVVSEQGKAKVRDHLVAMYQQYPEMTDEERSNFESAFQARTASLHATESGQRMLLNMDTQTFKSFALPSLEEILPALIERRMARKSQSLTAAATDAPLRTQTTGHEATTIAAPKGLRPVNTEAMMQQALAEARRMSRGSQ